MNTTTARSEKTIGTVAARAAQSKANPDTVMPKERNFFLAPFTGEPQDLTATPLNLTLPPVVQGPLDFPNGAWDSAVSARERVTVVLGPGATPRGIGEVVAAIVDACSDPPSYAIPAATVTHALLRYNERWLPHGPDEHWQVGLRLAIPVEVDAAATRWIVDRQFVIDLATGFYRPPDSSILDNVEVLDLPIPNNPDALIDTVGKANAAAAPADRGKDLALALTDNPFAVVFEIIETLGQYQAGTWPVSEAEHACAVALVEKLNDWQARQLGALTAGNAVLRRLWRAVRQGPSGGTPAPDQIRDRVARALGLAPNSGGWHDPTYYTIAEQEQKATSPVGPAVVPVELRQRLPRDNRTPVSGERAGGIYIRTFGRDLPIGTHEVTPYGRAKWTGPAYKGQIEPGEFNASHAGLVNPKNDPKLKQRLKVAQAIADIEGWLDACRAADAAMLSTGMQQWSLHTNTEMTTLLHRFRAMSPDHFDLYFGMHGLLTAMSAPGEIGELENPGSEQVKAANPDTAGVNDIIEGLGIRGFARYVTLRRLAFKGGKPGDDNWRLPVPVEFPPELTNLRIPYLGGTVTQVRDPGGTVIRTIVDFAGEWCGRIRLASLCSLPYNVNQLQCAAARFDRVKRDVKDVPFTPPPDLDTVPFKVQDLFTSELAAAAVLDQHINGPEHIDRSITAAVQRTKDRPFDDETGPVLRPVWVMRFVTNYIFARKFGLSPEGKQARDWGVMRTHDNPLDPATDSFQAW